MQTAHSAHRNITMVLAAALLLALGGCATAPGHSLTARQDDMVRRLAAECYWDNEGFRVLYGGLQVHTACRAWAREQVQVAIPSGVALRVY